MITHIVWWTLKPEANGKTAAENTAVLLKASNLLHGIKAARSIDVSSRMLPGTTVDCQIVLVSTHDNLAALDAYKSDPVHLEFASMVTAASDSRNCIDYEKE